MDYLIFIANIQYTVELYLPLFNNTPIQNIDTLVIAGSRYKPCQSQDPAEMTKADIDGYDDWVSAPVSSNYDT